MINFSTILDRSMSVVTPLAELLGAYILRVLVSFGKFLEFAREVVLWTFRAPFREDQFFKQLEFVGVKSTGIIALTSIFTGAVFALQTGRVYGLFNMESMVGATVGMSLTREIAPVFTALMVTARACSAMAAELGTMRVTEQVDALEAMAVNPIQYLVSPRVAACTIMVPLLTMIYNVIGVIGSYIVGIYLLGIDEGPFMTRLYYYVDADDIWGGLLKAAVFGFLIAVISCFMGFNTRNGAKGVGKATTRAVVVSSVTVLIVDYFLTTWILEYMSKS